MEKDDLVSILITIVIGFIGGGYLYVAHFTKLYKQDEVQTQVEQAQFSLVGEAYGSCGNNCPAFQIKNDGTYRYRYYTEANQPPTVREGTLPLTEQRTIKRALDEGALKEQSDPISVGNCNSATGGVDIKYDVVYKAQQYQINSCGTAVDSEGDLWLAFSAVWQYLQTVE
jgi:hypothetical protein